MMKKTTRPQFKRRAKGKTDYSKRLALLKSGKKRVVFRRSNKRVLLQLVEFQEKGDKTLASVSSAQLKRFGWSGKCNISSAYLAGYWLGKKALGLGVSEAVFDIGRYTPMHGGRVFAALKGLVDAGLKVPFNEEAFPKKERIEGKENTLGEVMEKISGKEKGNTKGED